MVFCAKQNLVLKFLNMCFVIDNVSLTSHIHTRLWFWDSPCTLMPNDHWLLNYEFSNSALQNPWQNLDSVTVKEIYKEVCAFIFQSESQQLNVAIDIFWRLCTFKIYKCSQWIERNKVVSAYSTYHTATLKSEHIMPLSIWAWSAVCCLAFFLNKKSRPQRLAQDEHISKTTILMPNHRLWRRYCGY